MTLKQKGKAKNTITKTPVFPCVFYFYQLRVFFLSIFSLSAVIICDCFYIFFHVKSVSFIKLNLTKSTAMVIAFQQKGGRGGGVRGRGWGSETRGWDWTFFVCVWFQLLVVIVIFVYRLRCFNTDLVYMWILYGAPSFFCMLEVCAF